MSKQGTTKLTWDFPLPRTHTGILVGNGNQGLMIWGQDRLCITVARAGFWDHRGGTPFTGRITYRELRRLLEAGDEAGVRAAFASPTPNAAYCRPCQLGGGRLELQFADGMVPQRAELDTASATLTVTLAGRDGRKGQVTIRQAMGEEVAWLETGLRYRVAMVPTWDYVGDKLAADGVQPPKRWASATRGGFCQTLPDDPAMSVAWHKHGKRLVIATALGGDAAGVARSRAEGADVDAAWRRTRAWWKQYWRDVPRIRLPDPELQHAWDYGAWKLAGMSTPGAVAATLQGPWMEEYQIPPWSNDYHFNINVQMIYWPALGMNRLEHFAPLWDLIRGWMPRLRENAEKFFEASDALMLPHAVDDQCRVVGSFWTGTIDQACSAWMAQMAWLQYRHSLDEALLRDVAWPLMTGAFNGYWAMLEEIEKDGQRRLSLPVSVSPEYNGAGMNAWGRDASFQLAALHALAATLPRAAALLSQPIDPRWERVRRELPPYSLAEGRRIALWQGQDLAVSHRHHSHLASIFPFCTIDPRDEAHRAIVVSSLRHWQAKGAGAWSGWCVPWASILCSRCGLTDAAVTWLHWWKRLFTNVGHGTLHDAEFAGCGGLGRHAILEPTPTPYNEVMQMDAGMGALTAIMELLVQNRADAIHVLPGIPSHWREFSFDGIRTEGAFLVGATVRNARAAEVRVHSLAGQPLRLAHGLGAKWSVNGRRGRGPVLETTTRPGQTIVLVRG